MAIFAHPYDENPSAMCRGCDQGWIWISPGVVPTVMPCWAHRPLLRVLWEAGNFLPEVADWWADAA